MIASYLSEVVSISKRFQRSTKLDYEISNADSLKGFVFQATHQQCLFTMANFILSTAQRSFTWTGTYGSGKSTLALLLCSLLGSNDSAKKLAVNAIGPKTEATSRIYSAFIEQKPRKIITLLGRRSSLAADFFSSAGFSSDSGRDALKEIVEEYSRPESGGLFIVIDELGKYLEDGNSDNCYFLQELAEAVNRRDSKVILLGILHQAFDAYAQGLVRLQREEWAKVQGRFVDISLLSSADEVLELLNRAIQTNPEFQHCSLAAPINALLDDIAQTRKIDRSSFARAFEGCYPLNPVSAALIGPLSRQSFLQNTRSIFNFLSSKEPNGFDDFLTRTQIKESIELYSPDMLWDYLEFNYESHISLSRTHSHKWSIAKDCVDRACRINSKLAEQIAKTAAVLELFKGSSGIECTQRTIEAALYPAEPKEIKHCIDLLVEKKILLFRSFKNSYSLFEGSDFDLEGSLAKLIEKSEVIDLARLRKFIPLTPLFARRHFARTGTMRCFSRELAGLSELKSIVEAKIDSSFAGRLILCFVGSDESSTDAEKFVKELKDPSLLVSFVKEDSTLSETAKELVALEELSSHPDLEGDAVARNELAFRLDFIKNKLSTELLAIFYSTTWTNCNRDVRVASQHSLISLLSEICDEIYPNAAVINNEFINRDYLSTNISRARKVLLQKMVSSGSMQRLGFEGFPPEAFIYASLLKESKIHIFDDGFWKFSTNNSGNQFAPLWEATTNFIQHGEKTSLSEIYELWRKPPFGLKYGVMPLLAMAYLLANINRVSVYEGKAFVSDLNEEFVEAWMLDPKNIYLRMTPSKTEDSILAKLGAALQKLEAGDFDFAPLSLARIIVRLVLTAPKWAQTTSILSEECRKFRSAVLNAWDPIELIYENLPEVFASEDPDEITRKTISSINEIRNATPKMLSEIRTNLLAALDADADDIESLRERAKLISKTAGQMQLEAFISRISTFQMNDSAMEGLLSLAISKPKNLWSDRDIEAGNRKLEQWSFDFRRLECLGRLRSLPTKRRLISLVVAGDNSTKEKSFDLSSDDSAKAQDAVKQINEVLSKLPKNIALAALIEQSIELLKDE